MNHTYWISIGRNVGERPLHLDQWHHFQSAVEHTVTNIPGASIVTEVAGRGEHDGIVEDAHLFLLIVPAYEVNLLRARLALLCRPYGQDAIGFVGGPGTDTLIRP